MNRKLKVVSGVLLGALMALVADGVFKAWAEQALRLHQPVPILGTLFRLTLGYNTGVAFGLFANGGVWPFVITGLMIVGLTAWLMNTLRSGDLPSTAAWPVGLLLGGAIANFADRLPDSRVTDFLDVGLGSARWPTFNLADSFIVVGATMLLWISLMSKHSEQDQPS